MIPDKEVPMSERRYDCIIFADDWTTMVSGRIQQDLRRMGVMCTHMSGFDYRWLYDSDDRMMAHCLSDARSCIFIYSDRTVRHALGEEYADKIMLGHAIRMSLHIIAEQMPVAIVCLDGKPFFEVDPPVVVVDAMLMGSIEILLRLHGAIGRVVKAQDKLAIMANALKGFDRVRKARSELFIPVFGPNPKLAESEPNELEGKLAQLRMDLEKYIDDFTDAHGVLPEHLALVAQAPLEKALTPGFQEKVISMGAGLVVNLVKSPGTIGELHMFAELPKLSRKSIIAVLVEHKSGFPRREGAEQSRMNGAEILEYTLDEVDNGSLKRRLIEKIRDRIQVLLNPVIRQESELED